MPRLAGRGGRAAARRAGGGVAGQPGGGLLAGGPGRGRRASPAPARGPGPLPRAGGHRPRPGGRRPGVRAGGRRAGGAHAPHRDHLPGRCAFPTRGRPATTAATRRWPSGRPSWPGSVLAGRGPVRVGVADGPFAARLAARRPVRSAHPTVGPPPGPGHRRPGPTRPPGRPASHPPACPPAAGSVVVVPPGSSPAFLAPMPVTVLADDGPEGSPWSTCSNGWGSARSAPWRRCPCRRRGALRRRGPGGPPAGRRPRRPPPVTAPPPADWPCHRDRPARRAGRGGGLRRPGPGRRPGRPPRAAGERLHPADRRGRDRARRAPRAGVAHRGQLQPAGHRRPGALAGRRMARTGGAPAHRPSGGLTRLWLAPDEVVPAGGRQLAFAAGGPGAVDAVEAGDRAARARPGSRACWASRPSRWPSGGAAGARGSGWGWCRWRRTT